MSTKLCAHWWIREQLSFNLIIDIAGGNRHKKTEQYGEVNTHEDSNDTSKHGNSVGMATTNGSVMPGGQPGQGMPSKVTKVKNNEKTLLLSSDDEFQ